MIRRLSVINLIRNSSDIEVFSKKRINPFKNLVVQYFIRFVLGFNFLELLAIFIIINRSISILNNFQRNILKKLILIVLNNMSTC